MKKRLYILLALLLACMPVLAAAGEIVTLESGAPVILSYRCTLPDGRLLLAGTGVTPDGNFSAALLRCLNPDRTISWEWINSGYCRAGRAVVIQDGTIAVVLDDREDGNTVGFFTQDGKPTGNELTIPAHYREIWEMTPSFMMMLEREDHPYHTDLLDWDGQVIAEYDGTGMPGSFGFLVQDADELTFWGQADNHHVAMMKMNARADGMLWNTVVDFQVPGMDNAWPKFGIKTESGYAGCMQESASPLYAEKKDVLVKLDAEGHVQWGKWKEFDQETICGMQAYNGKIVVFCVPDGMSMSEMATPKIFHWFGEDGTDLGTTKLNLTPEDFPFVCQYLETMPEAVARLSLQSSLFAMPDGLWGLAECAAGKRDGGYTTGEAELVMLRIPEP